MAAIGAEVTASWFLSSGVVGFFILLLLLSIFLTALCSDCSRRSFELRDSDTNKNPSALIRVVKLEDTARENPMISEIQSDEKDIQTNGGAIVMGTGGNSAAAGGGESSPLEKSVEVMLWRSQLRASQKQDDSSSAPPDSDHIYHTISLPLSPPPTNQEPGQLEDGRSEAPVELSDGSRNSVYAQVTRKSKKDTPPDHTPEVDQVEEEESSPPLPGREMEG
ncbi:hypothetical protein INR49_028707 [Caranx melampygus]|nr:hypothetical protein INR49_028707 [Caranx melampygus]